jgi:hypothetical protein
MKKAKTILAGLVCLALTSCGSLGTTGSGSGMGDILGSVLGAVTNGQTIGNVLSSVIGLDKPTQAELIGTWKYRQPGVAFTSENLLAKAGGEVAATKIEQETAPYFQKAGITAQNTVVVFNEDKTFKATIAGKSWSGTWTFEESTAKVTLKGLLLSVNCYAKREYGGIALLFESKKLLTVLQVLATMSGNETAQKVSDLSKNYDGIRLGFDLKK